jgi:hypothetical protein
MVILAFLDKSVGSTGGRFFDMIFNVQASQVDGFSMLKWSVFQLTKTFAAAAFSLFDSSGQLLREIYNLSLA